MPPRRRTLAPVRRVIAVLLICGVALAGGAASRDAAVPSAKPFRLLPGGKALRPPAGSKRPVLGIAFGGGGVRGFLHLGVIKALEQSGIRAKIVTGTSAGAIAAVLYASGAPYAKVELAVRELREWDLADLTFNRNGIVKGDALAAWVNRQAGTDDLAKLPARIGITATDIGAQKAVLIVGGDPGLAAQASASIPGVFVPVRNNGHTYIDGGVLDQVPVRFAKALGADVVIGVDIYCGRELTADQGSMRTAYNVFRLQSCTLNLPNERAADVLIQPEFEPASVSRFDVRSQAIEAGYRATVSKIPEIRRALARVRR